MTIFIVAILLATALSALFLFSEVSLSTLMQAQKSNSVLWVLDDMSFIFSLWGQQVGTVMSYEAGAMVMEQTVEL